MALAQSVSISDADIFVPAVSSTVVDRALWLDSRKLERPMFWALDACTDMFGLIGLLLADVQAEDHASAPHNLAGRLIALALDRPEILYLVLLKSAAVLASSCGLASLSRNIGTGLLADRAMAVTFQCVGSRTERPRRPNHESYRVRRRRINNGAFSKVGFCVSRRSGIAAGLVSQKFPTWLH